MGWDFRLGRKRTVTKARRSLRLAALGTLVVASGCADAFDTTRTPAPRGTIGQELFGVICDRVGAQALQEDLTGASFQAVCHPDSSGNYSNTVDQTQLPALSAAAVDVNGNAVPMSVQTSNRTYAVNRVQALARVRPDLIGSFDTVFPATQIPIVDLGNADPTQSCAPNGTGALGDQLADLLARFQPLYDDGTIPDSTESLARVFSVLQTAADAQTSLTHFEARDGYRPIPLTLGAARPSLAYPQLRDLANAGLALLSADSQPYNFSKVDSSGNRLPIPGPANTQFNALIAAGHDELLYATEDPVPAPLTSRVDPTVGRVLLSRPRTDLELLEQLFYSSDPAYSLGGTPRYISLRDLRGYAQVALVNGAIPAPFVDADGDGLADLNANGTFVTSDGSTPPTPFVAVDQAAGVRDGCGRALRGAASVGDAGTVTGQTSAGDAGSSGTGDAGSAGSGAGANEEAGAPPEGTCGTVPAGSLVYDYIDTSSVFASSLLHNLKPLANPDPAAQHDTLMYALAGAPLLFGTRDGSATSSKCYSPDPTNSGNCQDPNSLLKYNAFETDNSPLLDLVYALGQMLGDPTMDDTLAYVKTLFTRQLGTVARLAGDGLTMKAAANNHPEAKIPLASTFWDEMLDVTVQLEQEPGLLEDVLTALGSDQSRGLGQIFATYMQDADQVSYDPAHLNGPPFDVSTGAVGPMGKAVDRSSPDTGFNRSIFQRFLSLVHDTNGVTACNKEGSTNGSTDPSAWTGIVHAQGLPLVGTADVCGTDDGNGAICSLPLLGTTAGVRPFHECEVFKIENLASFYLDAIVGKASIYFRPDILRDGIQIPIIGDVGASNVEIIEESSGIGLNANDTYGFWDATTSGTFRPRPEFLNRLVFFDQVNDSPNVGDPNYLTNHFLSDLTGEDIGSSVCAERVIPDPCNNQAGCGGNAAAGVSADGMVHGLRTCQDGDWATQRSQNTVFTLEENGFYAAITPLLSAFVNHGREDIFVSLVETLYRHWADAQGTADECTLSVDPTAQYKQCTKDGIETYEPLLAEDFSGDIFSALHDLVPVLQGTTIPHCTATNPTTGACTAEQTLNGIQVLSNATRALVDPQQALAAKLVDRHGTATGLRNDGSTNPQVTPAYLLTGALDEMDAAFANQTNPDPNDNRLAQWRLARSQLVDQFLTVDGTGASSSFDNTAVTKILPTLIDLTRAQLYAYCPTSFAPPYTRCAWARDTLTTEATNVVHGPVFAGTMDLLEAVRTDSALRGQVGTLLQYLLDAASNNDAQASLLATSNDIIQLLKDDSNLVPLYKALAPALDATTTDAQGHILQKSAVDAGLALLGRISGRAYDTSGHEICSAELDPNQVLAVAITNMVTPVASTSGGAPGQAPIQTIMDAIGDVNRTDPSQTTSLAAGDYGSIADNVNSFLTDPSSGLEQFYAIVRNGTVH
jgi:hypothetical protein